MHTPPMQDGYIVEFLVVGKSMKVSAIDPATLREVSIIANPRTSRKYLTKIVLQKLRYVIEKEAASHE